MGAGISSNQIIQAHFQIDSNTNSTQQKKIDKDYDIDVIQICNTALAIKNKQHTINVQLSLRCQGLPTLKAFGSTDSMVVVLKNQQNLGKGQKKLIEIGRTQIVYNQINPKYMKSFVFPFKWQNSQQLQFKIYHIINPKSRSLEHQKLIGKVNTVLNSLVESQKQEFQIKQTSKTNSKAMLKLYCSQYESGNSYYQINIELTNFVFRSEVYFVIQSLSGQALPIAKSQAKKPGKFKQIKVSCNKFHGQDNCGIQIKVYDALKQQQIGSTKQFSIVDNTNDQKVQNHRVFHSGFFVGSILIHKWKKVTRDSFMSFIVGGARLHLLLAIDFTNSNSQDGKSLHDLDKNNQNVYINAIQQIVGVLQYFSIQNQVALYGFGAKLPPFYKTVSQCFALNGDYFHPNVEGGVQQIIRLYKENLKKIKMHGPTKISQILDLAIKYASEEQIMSTKSSTYYVLLVVTDGRINDYQDTVDLLVKASSLPLSILFVGVGNGDQDSDKKTFHALQTLDQETLNLKCSKTGKTCQRDIVDFIRMNDFADFTKDETRQALARQAFNQIPNHFIEYMSKKNIKPSKQKKSLKAAKAQFIAQKIKSTSQKIQPFVSSFLQKQRKQMKKKLQNLGLNDSIINNMSIAMNDLNYFLEVYSQTKKNKIQQNNERTEYINIREVKKLQQFLDKKDQDKKIKTLQKLQKIESNQYGRRVRVAQKKQQKGVQKIKKLDHPCLRCYSKQINVVHMQCGHSSQCSQCYTARCPVCYHINSYRKIFKYNDAGELQIEQSDISQSD